MAGLRLALSLWDFENNRERRRMHSAIAILAGSLVLACVASLLYIYRHNKASQSAAARESQGARE